MVSRRDSSVTDPPRVQPLRGGQSPVVLNMPAGVDVRTANAVRRHFLDVLQDPPAQLIVDMSAVEAFDVTAGAVLVGIQRRLRHAGGCMRLINLHPTTRSELRHSGLAGLLLS